MEYVSLLAVSHLAPICVSARVRRWEWEYVCVKPLYEDMSTCWHRASHTESQENTNRSRALIYIGKTVAGKSALLKTDLWRHPHELEKPVHNVVCFSVCVSVCVLLLGYEVCRRKEGLEGPGHIVWILLQEYFGCTAGMRILSENNSCSCGDWEVHHVLIHTAIQLKYLKALSFYTHTHTHNRGSVIFW